MDVGLLMRLPVERVFLLWALVLYNAKQTLNPFLIYSLYSIVANGARVITCWFSVESQIGLIEITHGVASRGFPFHYPTFIILRRKQSKDNHYCKRKK